MKVLVCGGAGYIGSHTAEELSEQGYDVIVFDNLEKGHKAAVSKDAQLIVGDLRDYDSIDKAIRGQRPDTIIDFSAYSLVGESVEEPLKYFENNLYGTLNLLKAMRANGVRHIVFSSTAATYGMPQSIPIVETDTTAPINPYGETKLAVEKMLKWADEAYGIRYAALRYFNVAGAHKSGQIGEDHRPETHLIPNVIKRALAGETVQIFGDDYNTKDGTCIRDYIHVTDLAKAHILALEHISHTDESVVYNLGNGNGFSNMDIISAVKAVSGLPVNYVMRARRAGDPDCLVASSEKIMRDLGWKPDFDTIESIVETAVRWHMTFPNGYEDYR